MAPSEIVNENLRAAMSCYAYCPGGERRDLEGVAIASSGINFGVFNSAMLTSPVRDDSELDVRINLARVLYATRGLSWSYWICEDELPRGLRARYAKNFTTAGMDQIAQPPGMIVDRLPPRKRAPAALDIRPVAGDTARLDFANLASIVFGLPFLIAKQVYANGQIWRSGMNGYLGYAGSKAVSLATVVFAGGVTGVYSLGTLPQHRGCGYGETLMRHAVEESQQRHGNETVVLQSTKQGFGLYTRMGFRVVTKFAVYLSDRVGSGR